MRIFAKDSHIFSNKKYQHICIIYVLKFNETITNDVVNFEQLALYARMLKIYLTDVFRVVFLVQVYDLGFSPVCLLQRCEWVCCAVC